MSKKDIKYAGVSPIEALGEHLCGIPNTRHLYLHTCYHVTVSELWKIDNRINTDLHLLLVLGGKGRYYVDGNEIELNKGRLIFVGAGINHSSKATQKNPPQIIALRFGIYSNSKSKKLCSTPPTALWGECFDFNYYKPLFLQISRAYKNQNEQNKALTSSLLHVILAGIKNDIQSADYDPRTIEAKKFIDKNLHLRLSLNDLAKKFKLSSKHFARLFLRDIGQTPGAYQIQARINRACLFLCEENFNVSETAFRLGYQDLFTFSHQFKEQMGVSPSKYQSKFLYKK
jgi:AraC-like DNA-binding protein